MPDYSGKASYARYKQWEALTGNESSVGLNLLWTDLFVNMVTTRSAGDNGGAGEIDAAAAEPGEYGETGGQHVGESKEAGLPTKKWVNGKGTMVVGLKCRGAAKKEDREGYQMVGGMVVGFVEAPAKGRVMELLKGGKGK
ncbi:hypothetical protein P167DRAFT_580168 [Morchella conica CCBAS932]|uniref:Uncharacterized protein n=1 Tax=Morchella conica CCBAS932 TaxID=1392247 RepID=A0A3N4KB62_9PEZI|nr:hypothetical protein P167DRAFT_580168 [Morchella conica CCBAS932]